MHMYSLNLILMDINLKFFLLVSASKNFSLIVREKSLYLADKNHNMKKFAQKIIEIAETDEF